MIGQRVPFAQAYAKTVDNKQRMFASSGKGDSGFERSHRMSFPSIRHTPKFALDKSAPVFTIGSCFARNIEASLTARGLDCITSRCIIPDDFYEEKGLGARNGALNAYTPLSMLELIKLSSASPSITLGALGLGEDQWMDMMMSGLRILSREELAQIREQLFSTNRSLPEASTVIITLGYTESWYDTQDSVYVNRSPGSSRRSMRHGDRYEFHNASASDTTDALEKIVSHLRSNNNDVKVIVTVSPVPLHGTFTDRDSVSANLYSKCTLLSAAVAVSEKYDFVDYFPSYELVTFSDQSTAWAQDGVHVNHKVVDRVVAIFHELYFV